MSSTELPLYRQQLNSTWKRNRRWIDGKLEKVDDIKDEWVQNRNGDPIQVRRYKSIHSNGKILFYLHGGGWVGRNIDTYDNFCRRVCRNTQMTVYGIGYRLSPETKFPGAIEDGVDMIRYIVSQYELDKNNLHLCGDSAGGNMAVGITYLLYQELRFQKLLLLYPPVNAILDQPSMKNFGKGYIIEKENVVWMRDQYLESKEQFTDPLVSPLLHPNFDFLPSTMVTIGGKDPLQDQVSEFYESSLSSGQSIKFYKYPDLPHGFYLLGNLSESVKQAYRDIYQFLL